jgi:two-component system, OmpR family, alkaline phosphatase synthesis response regulator PhoP
MTKALVITRNDDSREGLRKVLAHPDLTVLFSAYNNGFRQQITGSRPEILLLEISEAAPDPETWESIRKLKREGNLLVIALVQRQSLNDIAFYPDIDDFLASPYDTGELLLRINRLLNHHVAELAEPIHGHGLTINPDTCDVLVDGAKVELTFKEYEMLKLLASHKGHVFTRQVLLDKIWGYDYFGGDRTVDVHIRRLRSKIETNRTYIETVRNIGYRFAKDTAGD